jgi:hypothetical protein
MNAAICFGSKKSMEILFNVQPTLPLKNKIVPDLSEHDCTTRYESLFFHSFTRLTRATPSLIKLQIHEKSMTFITSCTNNYFCSTLSGKVKSEFSAV